jgi:hypothetical protein
LDDVGHAWQLPRAGGMGKARPLPAPCGAFRRALIGFSMRDRQYRSLLCRPILDMQPSDP